MKIRILVILGIAILFQLYCGKESQKQDKPGESLVEVDIPPTEWKSSIALVGAEGAHQDVHAASDVLFDGLSQSRQLKVYHPSTASVSRAETQPDYTLQYDVAKAGGKHTSRFILTDAGQDTLWEGDSEEFVITAAEQASSAVVGTIGGNPSELEPVSSTLPPDLMNLYLEGDACLARQTKADNERAADAFKTILKQIPDYIPAAVGLAEAYYSVIDRGWDGNLIWLRLAQETALNAIELDPSSATAHTILGKVYMKRGDFKQAEHSFRIALDENPNLEEAWTGLGNVFSHYGLYEPCLTVFGNALALNPSNAPVTLSKAMILIGLGRYDEAEIEIDRIIRIYPNDRHYFTFKALAKYYQGDLQSAKNLVKLGLEAEDYRPLAHAIGAMIHAKEQNFDPVIYDLETNIKPYVGTDASLATAVAAVYALIEQNGSALHWLNKAVEMGYREYPWIVNDPNFDGLKTDQRFQELMANLKTKWETNMRQYAI